MSDATGCFNIYKTDRCTYNLSLVSLYKMTNDSKYINFIHLKNYHFLCIIINK